MLKILTLDLFILLCYNIESIIGCFVLKSFKTAFDINVGHKQSETAVRDRIPRLFRETVMNFLLHTQSDASGIADMNFGAALVTVLKSVFSDAFIDTLKIAAFLFLAYLFMEFIEHKASAKMEGFIKKSGAFAPLAGGAVGLVPQCGFSAVASNFFTARVISLGTLIAVFLSTSDEMIPILISGGISGKAIFILLGYKLLCAVAVGFLIDFILRIFGKHESINIDEICENDNCHCERGVFFSALHHTLTVGGFVFIISCGLNLLIFLLGEERLSSLLYDKVLIGHFVSALVGLIPNCAISVLFSELCIDGYITVGTMLSGLFSSAGVGLIVLFKVNKRKRENLLILGILILSATIFGVLADFIGFNSLI